MTEPTPTPPPPPAPPKPPLSWLVGYRLLGLRLPERYRRWVARDVAGKSFVNWRITRIAMWLLTCLGLFALAMDLIYRPLTRRHLFQASAVLLILSLLVSGQTLVRRTLQWQRIDRYGRPVPPRRLAVLGNAEAVLLAVTTLVAFTGASALVAFARRPPGCDRADRAVVERLRGAVKEPGTQVDDARQVGFRGQDVVAAYVTPPGETRRLWFWFVDGDDIFEIRTEEQAEFSPTTFPPIPRDRIDRALGAPLERIADCLAVESRFR